jgi:hypothetical protein
MRHFALSGAVDILERPCPTASSTMIFIQLSKYLLHEAILCLAAKECTHALSRAVAKHIGLSAISEETLSWLAHPDNLLFGKPLRFVVRSFPQGPDSISTWIKWRGKSCVIALAHFQMAFGSWGGKFLPNAEQANRRPYSPAKRHFYLANLCSANLCSDGLRFDRRHIRLIRTATGDEEHTQRKSLTPFAKINRCAENPLR